MLIREHQEAVEADLLRYYQVDIAQHLGDPKRLSWRRLAGLIRSLPDDSATKIAHNKGRHPWSVTDYLLADTIDELRALRYITTARGMSRSDVAALRMPEPVLRPGMEPPKRLGQGEGMSPDDLRSRLDAPRVAKTQPTRR